MRALVLEIYKRPAAASDIVADVADDGRTVLGVDDTHEQHMVAKRELPRQENPGDVLDPYPQLLQYGSNVTLDVDERGETRTPTHRPALAEQPQMNGYPVGAP